MRIGLLGPLTISRNGDAVELTGPKRRALLALLALHVGTPLGRDHIIEALWPRAQTGREESTLRVHVSHIRDVLELEREAPPSVLVTVGAAYKLPAESVELDITHFDELTEKARRLLEPDPGTALRLLNEALELWRGRPLQDVEYEDFAQDEIRRLELARIDAIENRAEALIEVGEDPAAIVDLETLVRLDPTRERPVRLLMRALYRVGRQADALRVARRHARHLSERGLEPSPHVLFLEERILQHDPTLLPVDMMPSGELRPGRSVRGYELREEAGSGSIGVVFRAFQASVGREVAVKAIHPDLAQTPGFVKRFAEEARIVAGMEHPHIVPLYDFWREPGGAFLVMRWMDGGSLQDRMGEPWNPHLLGRVFDHIGEALGYAHSSGVVHRDVKPANVLFDGAGNAYLCDFGLAAAGVDTNTRPSGHPLFAFPPYAPPELLRGEGPTIASDIYSLGVMLAEAASGVAFAEAPDHLRREVREVVEVATSASPADRYPDTVAFRLALREALGPTTMPAPRRVRRNPYKGLEPFGEGDRADFYGRDDVVETLVGMVGGHGLTAVIGASGSGKSSLVMGGVVPALRDGALPGSDEWSVVYMVPGSDPFEEFHIALSNVAVGHPRQRRRPTSNELAESFDSGLDGPNSQALLVVDQFEEIFVSAVDPDIRERFLDELASLSRHPAHRVRLVLTLRADFADRPLGHPVFGDLVSKASLLLPPMRPGQIEEVIRRPAARVGVEVEPGLIAEIVRDVADAPAYLPLLQYVLSELFERRAEDRLTVQAYRSLGGVQGVLERRAEDTFSGLSDRGRRAGRQMFLRMVQLGDHGEETRRRLPVTELHGMGRRADTEEALDAFAAARLITYDRDPITRTPTIEVAHETVITRWSRYRVWIDDARADLLAHRRLSAAAAAWRDSGEDPGYLLTSGPLVSADDLVSARRIELNELESRFVAESREAAETAEELETERQRHEAVLEHRARRRLRIGLVSAVVAVLVGVVAVFAWVQSQRADDLAAAQERQNLAVELAAASRANLTSEDPDLSLLLAIAGAEQSIEAGEEILPEVVDALHLAIINPRPEELSDGAGRALGGNVLDYANDGGALVVLADDGGAFVVDPATGDEVGRIPADEREAFGVAFHPGGRRIMTTHSDGIREWTWRTPALVREIALPEDVAATIAVYSPNGSLVAIGDDDGVIRVFATISGRIVAELVGHEAAVTTLDFDNSGGRLVSAGADLSVLVWDIAAGEILADVALPFGQVVHAAWNPVAASFFAPSGAFALTTGYGEMWLYRADGTRINSFGNGNNQSHAVAFSPDGSFMVAAGSDGVARLYGTWTGGQEAFVLPAGGVPLRDAAFNPAKSQYFEVTTAGVDGRVRIWRDLMQSELPARNFDYIAPELTATPDGTRYAIVGRTFWYGLPDELVPTVEVVDATSGETLISRPTLKAIGPITGTPAISADGSHVSFTGPTGDIEIIDVDTGATTSLPDSAARDWAQAFSSDGATFASAGFDGSIAIWNRSSGQLLRLLEGHGDRVPINISEPMFVKKIEQLSFRPDSGDLASIGFDGTVRVWNPTTGEGRVLRNFDYELISLAYSPDGAWLAVVDRTGSIHVLDSDSGDEVLTPDPVSGPAVLVFSPDGDFLAGAGPGPFAHLWEMDEGRLVRRLQGSIYRPMDVAFLNDGSELLVMATEGVLRRYLLDDVKLVELARTEVTRDLTEEECRRYLRRPCDG